MPPDMIKTTIAPIVENKCGHLSESSNYKLIALATIISKVFESVLLLKCEEYYSQVQINLATRMVTVLTYVYMH